MFSRYLRMININTLSISRNSIYGIHSTYYSIDLGSGIGNMFIIAWLVITYNTNSTINGILSKVNMSILGNLVGRISEYSITYYVIFMIIVLMVWITIINWMNDLWMESFVSLTGTEQYSLIYGIKWLIVSECMLFFACFWTLINCRIISAGFSLFLSFPLFFSYSFGIPFSNLLILLFSGLPIQASQIFIKIGFLINTIEGLAQGLCCGWLFIFLQLKEFLYSYFTLSDVMIGSIFYFTTGLHGFHVLLGTFGFFMLLLLMLFINLTPPSLSLHLTPQFSGLAPSSWVLRLCRSTWSKSFIKSYKSLTKARFWSEPFLLPMVGLISLPCTIFFVSSSLSYLISLYSLFIRSSFMVYCISISFTTPLEGSSLALILPSALYFPSLFKDFFLSLYLLTYYWHFVDWIWFLVFITFVILYLVFSNLYSAFISYYLIYLCIFIVNYLLISLMFYNFVNLSGNILRISKANGLLKLKSSCILHFISH